ncbi:rod shape-determining protein MreC [Candidatus Gottesmanbacteria bacterium]|nr:rod shape-determining protein MreC [Candidatus Gottesmanbacteria bacterium]
MHATRIHFYIGIALFIFALDFFGILVFVKDPLAFIPQITKRAVFSVSHSLGNFGTLIFSYSQISEVIKERDRLKSDTVDLSERMRQVIAENESLRRQLEAPLSPSYSFVPATVVSISRYMEIDKGLESGIKVGMTVVDGNVLIGKVLQVETHRSLILLPTDIESAIPAKTSRETRGIVGGASGTLSLNTVLQKDPLFQDDTVITSGEEGFPPNLLIGKTAHINADDSSVYKQAAIIPTLDYKREVTVFVILTQ